MMTAGRPAASSVSATTSRLGQAGAMAAALLVASLSAWPTAQQPPLPGDGSLSCFLLFEVGVGEIRRQPAEACERRVTPASTFKIAHALAALDAGVVDGPDSRIPYDGTPQPFPAWRQDHTLRTAIRDSVVWYFQRVAERLGMAREQEYLSRFDYGNADPGSGLTTFWLGESLQISPVEQLRFLRTLYADGLPAGKAHMAAVRHMLIQPRGVVTNASGRHPFGAPWLEGTEVAAKTGNARDPSGNDVRWLVGHISRQSRAWIFVSLVTGPADVPPLAAVDLAARGLKQQGVL